MFQYHLSSRGTEPDGPRPDPSAHPWLSALLAVSLAKKAGGGGGGPGWADADLAEPAHFIFDVRLIFPLGMTKVRLLPGASLQAVGKLCFSSGARARLAAPGGSRPGLSLYQSCPGCGFSGRAEMPRAGATDSCNRAGSDACCLAEHARGNKETFVHLGFT